MELLRKTVSAIMLTLLLTSMLTLAFSFQPIFNSKAHANSAATRVEKAVDFHVLSQFDSHLNLCREAPEVAPNQYWLVSDNLWAFRALKMANELGLSNAVEAGRVANLIEAKLKEKANIHNLPTDPNGFPISFMHEAVIGDSIPTPNRTCNQIPLQSNNYTVGTEICNGTIMSDWQEYADRLLYMALSFHWQANDTAADYYFELAKAMWDGIGINDTATKEDGFFTTFKLALLLFTSKILGEKLPFELELVSRIWSLQRETDGGVITNYFSNGTSYGDANTETTSLVIIAILATQRSRLGTFAFYYPWYGTPYVSGDWRHWDHITDHPLLGFYDSNNETLIKEHISMAKEAGIDGFIVSWWGIGSFEDNASLHIKNVCEENNFKFTFYYENTSSVNQTINDLVYILNKYANSSDWYKIDDRPVVYIYGKARNGLIPQAWKLYGEYINQSKSIQEYWMLSEDVRKPPRYGIFPIHPKNETGIGYIESANPIFLQPNKTYSLKAGISDIRNDCPNYSDVGFRIKIRNETEDWKTLNESIVNFDDGWLDLSFNVSNYAGQNVSIMVESYKGGVKSWCSEWAAIDYFYIEDSKKGEIVSPEPFFDNGWKNVIDELRKRDFNPYFIVDFTGYQDKIQDFAEYFLNFTDGIHYYSPVDISKHLSAVFHVYNQASEIAHSKNKTFVATVMPGYNDTNKPESVVDRQNGTYYTLFWSIAKACFPDGYAITSFNEWHEGTEIEPSLEYGYQYINLTRTTPTIWTVDDDEPADFRIIQEAINTASLGDIVYVRNGTYYENIIANKTILLIGESRDATVVDGEGSGPVIVVSSNNTIIKRFTIRNSGDNRDSEWPCGIWLNNTSECGLLSNRITNNTLGVWLEKSANNTITRNYISANHMRGIALVDCADNTIFENNVANNSEGTFLYCSSNNSLRNNVMLRNTYNFGVFGETLDHFVQDIDTSNTVDGKPVYYWINYSDKRVPLNAGYVAIVNSINITVEELTLTHNLQGVLIAYSTNSKIGNNKLANNVYGVSLVDSATNVIVENKMANNEYGAGLRYSRNNILSENSITNNGRGVILIYSANNNTITKNDIVANYHCGIDLTDSRYNVIMRNNITANSNGVWLDSSCDNGIYHNNFVDNLQQVNMGDKSTNNWDDDYPSGGNYWSDYVGNDKYSGQHQNETDSDGIGDAPRVLAANNTDKYPLMASTTTFAVIFWDGYKYEIEIVSNSTVTNFQFNMSLIPEYPSTISFSVIGPKHAGAFCRIIIPNIIVQGFWNDKCMVLLNGEPWPFKNWTDPTNTYIYINYTHSDHEITIIPEFPSTIILPVLMLTTLIATVLLKKKRKTKPQLP